MSDIHLVIFCKSSYKDFLPYCSYSAEKFIQNKIVSKTIISEEYFTYENYNILTDEYVWKIIDPNSCHKDLYKLNIFQSGWIKQQILKLGLNNIISGDILILDADLIFLQPIKLIEDDKYNFYLSHEYDERYFFTMDYLLGLKKQTKKYQSFISDFCIFNTCILEELQGKIESRHNKSWLESIQNCIEDSHFLPIISEYEIYGNYVIKNHGEKLNKIIDPIDYKMRIDFPHYKKYSPKNLIRKVQSENKNYYQCINLNKSSFIKYV